MHQEKSTLAPQAEPIGLECRVSTTLARTRLTWIDHAKGVGIFLVVVGHVLRGLVASQILADGAAFRFVDSWIYTFHMPLFFLISGLFADRQVERPPGEFVRDKLATLAYPYLIWSVLQTLLQVALSRHTNHPTNLGALVWLMVTPIMQFWFLYALFLISLIYYTFRRSSLGSVGALAGFILLWSTYGWASFPAWPPLIAARANGIYYAFGSVLNRHRWIEGFGRVPVWGLALVVALGYGAIVAWVFRSKDTAPLIALTLALSGVMATMALAILFDRVKGLGFVRLLGVHSMEIFLAHTIASAGIRVILEKVLKVENAVVHIVLGTVGGIVLPLCLVWVCRRGNAEFLFRLPRRSAARTGGSAFAATGANPTI
jgi:fucose 4-O-acetylase-like acetyltransferase